MATWTTPAVSALLLLTLTLAAGCAASRPAPTASGAPATGAPDLPTMRSQQALAEPDPTWRATVQGPLAALGLSQVTVRLALDPVGGRVRLVEVLSPELSPADAQQLERAFEAVPWRPRVDAEGQAGTWTGTLLRERP